MRVGRSLSPGKVFLERNGVLSKITTEEMKKDQVKTSGYHLLHLPGRRDMLYQWGSSDSLSVIDRVLFPRTFSRIPTVTANAQGGFAEVTDVTTTGFTLRTILEVVQWVAYGME